MVVYVWKVYYRIVSLVYVVMQLVLVIWFFNEVYVNVMMAMYTFAYHARIASHKKSGVNS